MEERGDSYDHDEGDTIRWGDHQLCFDVAEAHGIHDDWSESCNRVRRDDLTHLTANHVSIVILSVGNSARGVISREHNMGPPPSRELEGSYIYRDVCPQAPVLQLLQDDGPVDLAVCAVAVAHHTPVGHVAFSLCQPTGVVRAIGKDPYARNAEGDGQ